MAPSNPIHLSLQSLLPTLHHLPPELTSLAASLLSQSRTHAPSLKPEEEIARVYACCDIAVDRLQGKLRLERGKARPPVPPRVYGKLRGYMDRVLEMPTTPRGGSNGDGGSGAGHVRTGKKTPESRPTSMRKKWAEARKPKLPTVDADEGKEEQQGLEVPGYAMPMIGRLCRESDASKAAPHVFTALSVVLKEFGREKSGDTEVVKGTPGSERKRKREAAIGSAQAVTKDDIPATILMLFIAVAQKMYGTEKLVDGKHFEAAKDFAADEKNDVSAAARGEDYFDEAFSRFDLSHRGNWLEMEWFDNVPSSKGSTSAWDKDNHQDDDEDDETRDMISIRKKQAKTPLRRKEKHGKSVADSNEGGYIGRAGLLPGLGTMFQPAIDWLSEESIAEYQRWDKEIRRDIGAVEQSA